VSALPAAAQAPLGRRLVEIVAVRALGVYRVITVSDPGAPAPAPGQFAMLAAAERWGGGSDERPFLARAFSVARHEDGSSQFLLEDVGPGTKRLCEVSPGERLWLAGPFGRGFSAPEDRRRAILVGGGVGIAPLAILQDELEHAGVPTKVLLGFRDGARVPGADLLRSAEIATDDGSAGHHGLVTALLESELAADPVATVYACGPSGMLEGVRALCERERVPAQLALESGMACGYGACYGCVVPARDGRYLRVCVDGPVIDAALLDRVEEHAGAHA
jgi:dihydroorotate dehydrogenase electron transfer subunit